MPLTIISFRIVAVDTHLDSRLVKINVSLIREPANDGIGHVFSLVRWRKMLRPNCEVFVGFNKSKVSHCSQQHKFVRPNVTWFTASSTELRPLPPTFLGRYNFITLSRGCSALYIVKNVAYVGIKLEIAISRILKCFLDFFFLQNVKHLKSESDCQRRTTVN